MQSLTADILFFYIPACLGFFWEVAFFLLSLCLVSCQVCEPGVFTLIRPFILEQQGLTQAFSPDVNGKTKSTLD